MKPLTRNCAGIPRRDFLQLGIGGMLGLGFADALRLQAGAAAGKSMKVVHTPTHPTKPVNCIMVWLDGGPSHYETFDPKPDAPSGIRGDFKPISTSVPGIHFSEAVPEPGKVADQLTILRSLCHKAPNHCGGYPYLTAGAA